MSIVDGIIGAGIVSADLKRRMSSAESRLRVWAGGFRGIQPIRMMQSPPTVTRPESTVSSIAGNTSNNGAGIPAAGLYPKLELLGSLATSVQTGNPNNNAIRGLGPALTDGTPTGVNFFRARFSITVPEWEAVILENTGAQVSAIIDGEFIDFYTGLIPAGLQSGNVRYQKFALPADVATKGFAANPAVATGGTGYTRGNILTAVGGTGTPATFVVRAVSSGVVTLVTIQNPGNYSVVPSSPISVTGGSGTGATFTSVFQTPFHTTYKPRNVELLLSGADLYGINYTAPYAEAVIGKYKANPWCPRLYWLGDSQDAMTYGLTAGAEIGYLVAHRLQMADNFYINAWGGTGFGVPNGTAGAFEHVNRMNGIIASAPDVVVFPYSQNVGSIGQTASTAAAVLFIQTLQIALPNTLFVMVGPAAGHQSWHLTAMNAVMAAAPYPNKIRMIDTITELWDVGDPAGYLVNEGVHWGIYGNVNWRSHRLANQISYALLDMIAP